MPRSFVTTRLRACSSGSHDYLLEGLILQLELQNFGHRMERANSWEKTSDARKDGGQEEKGTTEGEMAGWHHGLDGHESE